MSKLFDGPIENIISAMRKQRTAKRVFAFESLIEKRIIRDGGAPIIEGKFAYFFCPNEDKKNISIVGDWNKWETGIDSLNPIHPKSFLYYHKIEFPIDARFSYRFQKEGEDSFNDPLNPNSLQEVFGNNTFVMMPGYKLPQYLEEPDKKHPKGRLINFQVRGNSDISDRTVQIFIPKGLRLSGKQRLIYLHDGAEAVTIGKFTNVLNNLYYYEPHLQKVIAVFIPPVDRHKEYMLNHEFSQWIAEDLTQQVEKKLRIKSEAKFRAVGGVSLGGLCAAHIGLNHSNKFGNIISQSPSFWINDFQIVNDFAKSPLLPLRLYLHTGTINDALEGSLKMMEVLQQKGYNINYRQTSESHNWANWSGKYADIIRWMASS
jgi:enterochelin esterase-like enzyme